MSKQKAYWEELLGRYKTSDLSQPEFCKQNNLSMKQFQYRWYEHNKSLKEKKAIKAFEPISVVSKAISSTTINLSIYLPNQIRCDVSTDLDGFSSIMSQVVQLC